LRSGSDYELSSVAGEGGQVSVGVDLLRQLFSPGLDVAVAPAPQAAKRYRKSIAVVVVLAREIPVSR
jgi:hypothetical protein